MGFSPDIILIILLTLGLYDNHFIEEPDVSNMCSFGSSNGRFQLHLSIELSRAVWILRTFRFSINIVYLKQKAGPAVDSELEK